MTTETGTAQAFPAAWGNHEQGGDYIPGMDLRTYIATQALAGLLAGEAESDFCTDLRAPVRAAVQMADALIAELNK